MKRRRDRKRLACLAGCFLANLPTMAQYVPSPNEPRWLTMNLDRTALGVYAEGYQMDASTLGDPTYRQRRYFVGPLIGLGISGAVYHPDLLDYRISLDGSLGYMEEDYRNGGSTSRDTQLRYLGNFAGDVKLLDSKPLNGRLFSSYSHTYQDYDFFNRVYLDELRYGGGLEGTAGRFRLSATAYRDTQDATGYGVPMSSDNRVATIEASHSRDSGGSSLTGTINDYTRTDYGVTGSGLDYLLAASDSEDFGDRKQFHSFINANFNHNENTYTPTDLYSALGNLRIEHSDTLSSFYNLNLSRNTMDGATSDNMNGNATLRHQLYESLTSELLAEGYRYSIRDQANRQDSWQIGGGPGFNYVKSLSSSSTLSAYERLAVLHTEVDSTGGILQVVDEQHSFGPSSGGVASGSFTLSQPGVIPSTIVITDTANQPPGGYVPGYDYEVIPNGQLVIIQRRAGSRMPDTVLVSYSFDASPSGAYETLNNLCGLRFDFFDHHWAIYTRLNLNQNYNAGALPVQDLNDWVSGTEATWKFIRAGVEYENYDSSLSPFKALRFFQIFNFALQDRSSLSLNFRETFARYEMANRDEQNYSAILRYTQALNHHLGLTLELGANQRVGEGIDQTLAVVRPQLQYVAGSFSATIGYDYGYDEYQNTEKRVRNMGFIRLRKDF